jgi:hypothetical protein
MDLSGLGKTVAKYAPLLGAVLPVPGGIMIGQAIAQAFGGDVKDTPDLIKRIENDPEAVIKLKQIESNERIEIERLAVERIRTESEDRKSARNREIQLADKLPGQIAKILLIGYFGLIFFLMYSIRVGAISPVEQEIVKQIIEKLSLAVMLVLAYYFGASYKNI